MKRRMQYWKPAQTDLKIIGLTLNWHEKLTRMYES